MATKYATNYGLHFSKSNTSTFNYAAYFLNNEGKVLEDIYANNPEKLLSKAVIFLEEKYPNAICRIKDVKNNKLVSELKKRHYYE